jgi:hypothetical protein
MNQNGRVRLNWALGILLVITGLLFLLRNFVPGFRPFVLMWPLLIVIPGLLFFVGMVMGGPKAGPLAIPGSIVTGTGLLLLYQNITDHWASWAYAWTLYLGFIGIGIAIHGAWSGERQHIKPGFRLVGISLAAFVMFGMFFELILNVSGPNLVGNLLWPGLLIAAGLYFLLRNAAGKRPAGDGRAGARADQAAADSIARAKRKRKSKKEDEETGFEPLRMDEPQAEEPTPEEKR